MAEQKIIPTSTVISTFEISPNIEIFTFYEDGISDTKQVFIAESDGSRLGTSFTEGELVVTLNNASVFIDYELNSSGELIVYVEDTRDNSDNYSLDEDTGELIYTC